MKRAKCVAVGLACAWLSWTTSLAGEQTNTVNTSEPKVGIYDSRVIAYAHFSSEAWQQKLNAWIKSAREAKAAGQAERFKELDALLKKEQERNHLHVFSTAPMDDILAEMKDRVEAVKKEAGVSSLVSKWDNNNLKPYPRDRQTDMTDLLLREFKLTERQRKVVEDMRKKEPLPLEKAEELLRKGEL